MSDTILICTDGSELSERGIEQGVQLAKALGLSVVGLTAVPGAVEGLRPPLEEEETEIQERLLSVKREAEQVGVPYELIVQRCPAPHIGILAVAREKDARFIVMASRGLGSFGSLILGSETQKVLAEVDRPVLVIR